MTTTPDEASHRMLGSSSAVAIVQARHAGKGARSCDRRCLYRTRSARRHRLAVVLFFVVMVTHAALTSATVLSNDAGGRDRSSARRTAVAGDSVAKEGFAGAPVGVTYEDAQPDVGDSTHVGIDAPPEAALKTSPVSDTGSDTGQAKEMPASHASSSALDTSHGAATRPLGDLVDVAPSNDGALASTPSSLSSLHPSTPGVIDQLQADGGDNGNGGLPSELPDLPTDRNCRLLGPFALFVQSIMGVVVVGSLVLKRQHERPMRPWKIWMLDISKQMLGQLFVHILNVILSSLGSMESVGGNNPCSLYFINIAIDTTIGVLFIYYCMRFLTHYFTDVLGWAGFVSGQYTSTPSIIGRRRRDGPRRMPSQSSPALHTLPEDTEYGPQSPSLSHPQTDMARSSALRRASRPRLSFFFKQLSLYLLSLFLMKVMVLLLFGVFPVLFKIGRWVLSLFGDDRRAQVFFVMAIFPLLMNTLQFWLIDSVLRHNPNTSRYLSDEDTQLAGGTAVADGHYPSENEADIEAGGIIHHAATDDVRGEPWTGNWWAQAFGLASNGKSHRGAYQEISTQGPMHREDSSVASSDHSEDDHSSQHTYPPVNSTSSSTAGLDATNGHRTSASVSSHEAGKAKSANRNEAARDTSPMPTSSSGHTMTKALQSDQEEEDADDAWDAWGEDDNEGVGTADTITTVRPSKITQAYNTPPSHIQNSASNVRKKLD